jgi:lysozyme
LLAETEGFIARPCSAPDGNRFIGFGHAISDEVLRAGHIKIYGADIDLTKGMTEAQGLLLLYDDMQPVDQALNKIITVPLTDPQRAALESLIFNVGLNRARPVLDLVNARRFSEAAQAFKAINTVGGRVYPGLQRRRDREIGMWISGS